jgi:ornithine decarboxylase
VTALLAASPTISAVTAPQSRLDRLIHLAQTVQTPTLLVDSQVIGDNYRRIATAFPSCSIYYAVKANPDPSIVTALIRAGCGMDVASRAELDMVLALEAKPHQIIFSAPFKRPAEIAHAFRNGVTLFVADSFGEVMNIATHAPGSYILIRVAVPSGDSLSPMGAKFGANFEDVLPLLDQARRAGLVPWGLHFHVGSQCIDAGAWARAIAFAGPLWRQAAAAGMPLHLMDIGGGFPVRYNESVPAIEAIARCALAAVTMHLGPDARLALEPGRWMSRRAATLVTEVIGMARRGDDDWVYLDTGVYNGLIDMTEGVVYPMRTTDELQHAQRRPRQRVTLAGPSCDGNDVMARDVEIPEVAIGDRLVLFQAGAYTTAFQRFNGLDFPQVLDVSAPSWVISSPDW